MRVALFIACALLAPCLRAGAPDNQHNSSLDTAALRWAHASQGSMNGLAYAGRDIVAVGRHGIVLRSGDAGRSWTQSDVPVQSDLVAVAFRTAEEGWAVGHEGVVLKSQDAGRTWVKKFDGAALAQLALGQYRVLAAERPGDAAVNTALEQAERLVTEGRDKPLLDVWFQDANKGFVVGAFGLLFATEDGGASWKPWLDRIDNPNALHINAVSGDADNVYLAGEQGKVFRLGRGASRFVDLTSPFQGSFFGISVRNKQVLLHGLRGRAFVSSDAGESWQRLATGTETPLVGGAFLPDGRIALAGVDGAVLVNDGAGGKFKPSSCAMACHALIASPDHGLVAAGGRGVRIFAFNIL